MCEQCCCGQSVGRFHFINKLGECPRCMRLAWWGSVTGWLGLAAAVFLSTSWSCKLIALVVACGLSVLWLAHWGAYIGKAFIVRDGTRVARRRFLQDLLAYAFSGVWLSLDWRNGALAQGIPPSCPPGTLPCHQGFMPGVVQGEEFCVEFIPGPGEVAEAWKKTCEHARAGAMVNLSNAAKVAGINRCASVPCAGHARCLYRAHELRGVRCRVWRKTEIDPKTKRRRTYCCAQCSSRVWLLCCCLPIY